MKRRHKSRGEREGNNLELAGGRKRIEASIWRLSLIVILLVEDGDCSELLEIDSQSW